MQTTIPYIDAQPVNPRDGVWLSGVGLYHKGHPGINFKSDSKNRFFVNVSY